MATTNRLFDDQLLDDSRFAHLKDDREAGGIT
jgi:hypothetical protein